MKILVTGGAGFIGSNVVDAYLQQGHEVTIIDNLSTGRRENINPKAEFIEMDIQDKGMDKIFKEKKFDILNHHAAQIDVRISVTDPCFDANVNIIGSLNLLENAKKYKVKKVIFISTGGAIYGECEAPKNECDKARPISPYGIAKYTIENYIKFYSSIYGLNYTILRYANVYGPRQNPKGEAGVVSVFSTNMLNKKDSIIFGDGMQERDYVFVGDIVKANVLVLDVDNAKNKTVNIGTGVGTNVNDLYSKMADVYGYNVDPKYTEKRAGEIERSILDVSKMDRLFRIKPCSLEEGLKFTAEYYKNFYGVV
ncbi:NAD-dependent epimerase/dehydratase family protein [bacterium]